MSWTAAQAYCTQNYDGLASINNRDEYEMLLETPFSAESAWIGLHRSKPNSGIWLGTDGKQSVFFDWAEYQPNNLNGTQDCVQMLKLHWNDFQCYELLPFFCYRNLILVKENKSWEEALQYCRSNYIGLASINSVLHLQQAQQEIELTQTESVWTGLCYLDEKWLWVNKDQVGSLISIPPCPDYLHRCAALNSKTKDWENRDCNRKMNFFCY